MLTTYNFIISYIKGIENARANALNRKPEYIRNSQLVLHIILKQKGDLLIQNKMQLISTIFKKEFKKHYRL